MQLKKAHFVKAILTSNNSAPGPDGIPFIAWRRCAKFSASILLDVARFLGEVGPEGVDAKLTEEFNHSLLFFLPKKPSGTESNGEGFYESPNARPLN
eukprot:4992951-Pyramimonas_sp.AAC.1